MHLTIGHSNCVKSHDALQTEASAQSSSIPTTNNTISAPEYQHKVDTLDVTKISEVEHIKHTIIVELIPLFNAPLPLPAVVRPRTVADRNSEKELILTMARKAELIGERLENHSRQKSMVTFNTSQNMDSILGAIVDSGACGSIVGRYTLDRALLIGLPTLVAM